jgi:ABC-type multidrug transport system ATPase subunit
MFGLLGPNGAGKSTLMRTIATLQEADEGSIHFSEIDVLKNKNEVRKILGYLPQDFGVYPKVTAEAMLDHFAVLKGITQTRQRREIVRHLLQVTNLYEVRNRKLGTFSGGMKQRFGIAQALIGDPRLIIVDEPTAGLDPEERNRFLNLLGEIGENIVVILSTHIVADVEELCRRMAIISEGTLLLSGAPRTVIAGLQGKIWQKLIAKNEVEACKDAVKVISTRWFGGRVVIHAWSEANPGSGFEPVEADLQDVYFTTLKQHQAA